MDPQNSISIENKEDMYCAQHASKNIMHIGESLSESVTSLTLESMKRSQVADTDYFGNILCGEYVFQDDLYNPDYRIGRLVKYMQKKDMKRVYGAKGLDTPIGKEAMVGLINESISSIPDTVLLRIGKRLGIVGTVFAVKRSLYSYSL